MFGFCTISEMFLQCFRRVLVTSLKFEYQLVLCCLLEQEKLVAMVWYGFAADGAADEVKLDADATKVYVP